MASSCLAKQTVSRKSLQDKLVRLGMDDVATLILLMPFGHIRKHEDYR